MKITGSVYRDMVISAACCLDNNKETINNLNVFPVPDGDTGINMSLTMSGVRGDFSSFNGTVGETAHTAANLMLRSARGNSGVILSLFFRGIGKIWKDSDEADVELVIAGLKKGVSEAYRAVMKPTEGTILTVMRVMTEKAEEAYENGKIEDIVPLFELMKAAAEEALETTPELLPQLKQAGVVDSGGYGFCTVIEGMLLCLKGTPVVAENNQTSEKPSGADFSDFDTENIKYAYCTECIVTKNEKYQGEGTSEDLHKFIMNLGDSVVFVDDVEIIKLHVHTNKPGKVITEALRYGSLYTVKIENMKRQHSTLSDGASTEKPEEKPETVEEDDSPVKIEKKYGFVTVCMGDGMENMFKELAADQIVSGGQTMNPSTENIVKAIENAPAEIVFVLPNNKNICMVAHQAERIARERRVVVLETVSVPEGASAMMNFNPDAELDENVEAMQSAIDGVTTLSTTYAVRDTEIGDTKIKQGEILGLYNGKIICTSDDRLTCINGLISKYENDAAIVTVYSGEGSTASENEKLEKILTEAFPDADVIMMEGGQPVYSYVISIE